MVQVCKKVVNKALRFVAIVTAFPVALCIILLYPFVRIRVGYFDARRIGHFCFDLGFYFSQIKNEEGPRRTIDIFFLITPISNSYLESVARRKLNIVSQVEYVFYWIKRLPLDSMITALPQRVHSGSRDKEGDYSNNPRPRWFSDDEKRTGDEFLNQLGISRNDKWVCLCVRDSSYLNATFPRQGDHWSYHDYRDSQIEDYRLAARTLADQGYKVIRMGKIVKEPFGVEHPNVIDYSGLPERSDFLDVWLIANCYFCISTNLGLDQIAIIFKRPLLIVNALPLMDMPSFHQTIFVPKHLVWREKNHHLSIREYLAFQGRRTRDYEHNKIDINNLHESEILEAVTEMEKRLRGVWVETVEDQQYQQDFWAELRSAPDFAKHHNWIHPRARIGSSFIRSL